jgi:hypothetical protein
MTQVRVDLPDAVTSVLHCAPEELDRELRLAAATQWYQLASRRSGPRVSPAWTARISCWHSRA